MKTIKFWSVIPESVRDIISTILNRPEPVADEYDESISEEIEKWYCDIGGEG